MTVLIEHTFFFLFFAHSWLKVIGVTFLSYYADLWPFSLQIYSQKESQKAGYIDLALQAYEQIAGDGRSSAAWLDKS